MNVKKLIEVLEQLPEDLQVRVEIEDDTCITVSGVTCQEKAVVLKLWGRR